MPTRIEIFHKPEHTDHAGEQVCSEIHSLGINSVEGVRTRDVYLLEGDLSEKDIETVCAELLADIVVQDFAFDSQIHTPDEANHTIEVIRKPGVMDPVEFSAIRGIRDLGLEVKSLKRARRYLIKGRLSHDQLGTIATGILSNGTIEDAFIDAKDIPYGRPPGEYVFKRITVPLLNATEEELAALSKDRQLYLNVEEMNAIRDYFMEIGREPTDIELETIAQTWSEHCMHKTLRGLVDYNGKIIDNLLKQTIMRATHELRKPWCISVFEDNAGIIEFDADYGICFKVETHNHPSAIEPYGGASTGIGGVIRDILGCGLGARPIMNTDVFCFGPPDLPYDKVPRGALHPRRVFKGVVQGVRDYGNRMGIPTANGAIFFDERYVGNPLVFCGNVGLIPRDRCVKAVREGDLIVVVGGRTGRDGIHGATFSSSELTVESDTVSSGSVQIGNPITEKTITDTLLEARDRGLFSSITDCGAGGLSSAVGEMGKDQGAVVDLDKVPLKYSGLSYWEIWVSEAQERMVLAVPPHNAEALVALFQSEDVEATVIGEFSGKESSNGESLILRYEGEVVGELDMEFLHEGLPRVVRKAMWTQKHHPEPELPEKKDYTGDLLRILSSWNVCSKESVIRQYDHEVQGGCVLKPLQGINNDGPGDASIVTPVLGSDRGVIVSCGMNPRYGDIDPYHMAACGIDEALRQVISVGGDLRRTALLDNFCWGNTQLPDRLGGLVRAATACYHMALYFGTPFISGKDSLNNEFSVGDETICIPPTLLISAVSVMEDVRKAVSMDAKSHGNLICVVGSTRPELGGSHYYHINGYTGNDVPRVDTHMAKKTMVALSRATGKGLVRACHDCSEGGIAVAAAEMSLAGGLGMELSIKDVPTNGCDMREDTVLFSESPTRFIVEVSPDDYKGFKRVMKSTPCGLLGKVRSDTSLIIRGKRGRPIIFEDIRGLKEAWQSPLKR
ncbi:MAG: phosphoribosylformylglycinamidine synthase subunit PurL [Planctomycetota bacterium]|jgi:phosphoribosylformylglycinamidine synthase